MSNSFMIKGLAGKKALAGTVHINGAKNAALKAVAASVLFGGSTTLKNVPKTADIFTLSDILTKLGAKVSWAADHELHVDAGSIDSTDIDPHLAGGMRASVVLTGPLLARFGQVSFPAPGGCVIGARPIDLFIDGYKKMGAEVVLEKDLYRISAPDGLVGADIHFRIKSVGGTETLMMAAMLARGETTLTNCAKEPEIVNLAEWLISCGAKIKGAGTDTVRIKGLGKSKLLKPVHSYVAIPDRIEAGSFLILGALCAHDMTISDCEPDHLGAVINLLKRSGVPIKIKRDRNSSTGKTIVIEKNDSPNASFKSFDFETREYPGFPTDLQAPMVIYLTQTTGKSYVEENIFEDRFRYVDDLRNLGANISTLSSRQIEISGPTPFVENKISKELKAHDIRAGFAIALAALVGKGKFTISNVKLIDRGYEKLEEVLKRLGAEAERI